MPNEQVKIVMAVVLPRWKPGAHSTCGANVLIGCRLHEFNCCRKSQDNADFEEF
jgi:hypothetical protein